MRSPEMDALAQLSERRSALRVPALPRAQVRAAWRVAALALAACAGAAAGRAEAQEVRSLGSRVASVYNLAGSVSVVRGDGRSVVVEVTRGGADADRLRIETGSVGGRASLRVVFPSDRVVYREAGGRTSLRVARDGTFFGRSRGGRDVLVSNRGRGLEAHADVVVRVPRAGDVKIYLGAGAAAARGAEADLAFETGAGAVSVSDVTGDVLVDTGSGEVSVSRVEGHVSLDTGSGRVRVSDVTGRALEVATGSGAVQGEDVSAQRVLVDTGSGRIRLEALASPRIECDTGSGSVHLSLASDVDRVLVDTGSGSVTLVVPEDLGAELRLDTSSGRISVDAPGAVVDAAKRGSLRGTLGDGVGRIVVDTGAGNVRIRGG